MYDSIYIGNIQQILYKEYIFDKKITLMKINWKYTGNDGTRLISVTFSWSLMVPLRSERVRPHNGFKTFGSKRYNGHF